MYSMQADCTLNHIELPVGIHNIYLTSCLCQHHQCVYKPLLTALLTMLLIQLGSVSPHL